MNFSFGFMCNDASLSTTALAAFKQALLIEENGRHGWGLAYYHAGEPLLKKQPHAVIGKPLDLGAQTAHLRSSLIVGHVGGAASDDRVTENTQPFRFRNWVFCHLGSFDRFAEIRETLLGSIPDYMRRNMHGTTDSEVLFHLLVAFLNDTGRMDDELISSTVASQALQSALSYVDRLNAERGGRASPHCCIATNGRCLVAAHREIPLAISRHSAYTNLGRNIDDRPISYPHLKAVLLAGGRMPAGPGWEAVDPSAVVCIDAELNIEYCRAES